jgi:hypothetical protein
MNCRRPPRSRTSPRSRTAPGGKGGLGSTFSAAAACGPRAKVGWLAGGGAVAGPAATRHRGRRAARGQGRQGVKEQRLLLGIEQADELRLERRAGAVSKPAAQSQGRGNDLRTDPGVDPLQSRRRKVERRHAIDRGAELAILDLAEGGALLRQARLRRRRQGGQQNKTTQSQ